MHPNRHICQFDPSRWRWPCLCLADPLVMALPLLFADSLIQESIRLSSGVFMVRYVTEDTHFESERGQKYLIRQGDRIAIYPPALHKDPDIFEDPMVCTASALSFSCGLVISAVNMYTCKAETYSPLTAAYRVEYESTSICNQEYNTVS